MNTEFTRDVVSLIRLKHQLIRSLYMPVTQIELVGKVEEITNKYFDIMQEYNNDVISRLVYLTNKSKDCNDWLELSFLLSSLFDSYFKYAREILGESMVLIYVKHSIKSFIETFSVMDENELDDPALKSLIKHTAEDIINIYSNTLNHDPLGLISNYKDFLLCIKSLNLYHSFGTRRIVINQSPNLKGLEQLTERY